MERRVRELAGAVEAERERAQRVEAEYVAALQEAGRERAAQLESLDAWRAERVRVDDGFPMWEVRWGSVMRFKMD